MLRVADLSPYAPAEVGRSREASIVLDDATVSRRHFRIYFDSGSFVLENMSQTNPTRIAGTAIAQPVRLSDQTPIRAGELDLVFHDLTAGDRFSGPVCSHCGRENSGGERDCWYCGTSLVNAPTTVRERRLVGCRVIAASGAPRDLYPGQRLAFLADGNLDPGRTGEPPPRGEVGWLELPAEGAGARGPVYRATPAAMFQVNGAGPSDGQPVRTGDQLLAGAARFTVAVR